MDPERSAGGTAGDPEERSLPGGSSSGAAEAHAADVPKRARDASRIEAILHLVPELSAGHASFTDTNTNTNATSTNTNVSLLTPLSGGITNTNYRIDTSRGSFVLRLGGAGTEILGIDRTREHACSLAAAAAGVGAPVVAFLPEHGALITRFIEGRVLAPGDLADPALMLRVVTAVRRFHEGRPVPDRFSPWDTVRDYHALAKDRGVPFPPELDLALSRLTEIEQALTADAAPLTPCHNDLLPANFIDTGDQIYIIDWEYAAMGDRYFDLGNLAVNFQLTSDGERDLLTHYHGQYRPDDHRRLLRMRLASDMRESLWGFLQAGVSTLEFDFLDYGRAHLKRFLDSYKEA